MGHIFLLFYNWHLIWLDKIVYFKIGYILNSNNFFSLKFCKHLQLSIHCWFQTLLHQVKCSQVVSVRKTSLRFCKHLQLFIHCRFQTLSHQVKCHQRLTTTCVYTHVSFVGKYSGRNRISKFMNVHTQERNPLNATIAGNRLLTAPTYVSMSVVCIMFTTAKLPGIEWCGSLEWD